MRYSLDNPLTKTLWPTLVDNIKRLGSNITSEEKRKREEFGEVFITGIDYSCVAGLCQVTLDTSENTPNLCPGDPIKLEGQTAKVVKSDKTVGWVVKIIND